VNAKADSLKGLIQRAWQALRQRFWLSLLFDAGVILAVFVAIHAWQTRDLPVDVPAPPTALTLLNGSGAHPAIEEGAAGIVYFFAPWCIYCKTSIDNLDSLVESQAVAWGKAVALDYGSTDEVLEFVRDTELALPVLLGDTGTAAEWSVRGFPTYYVIDAEGNIASRSVGYSSWLGMKIRYWMAK
jgi:thiol-disulfide isomerase/thioredoxin